MTCQAACSYSAGRDLSALSGFVDPACRCSYARRVELQRLIDSLGGRLGRSIALDDPSFRLIAYTSHPGEVDEARIESIMQRGLPRERVDYIRGLGALEARDLFTVPARPDLGFAIPRIGMPIRYDGTLHGFLWLLESDGPLSDRHAGHVRHTAEAAATALQRQFLLGELERHREGELARDLLAPDSHLWEEAAASLVGEELLAPGPVAVLSVSMPRRDGDPLHDKERLAIAVGLEHARGRLPRGHAVHLERPDHGILVVSQLGSRPDNSLTELATALHDRVAAESGEGAGAACWVGIGEPRESLVEAHSSYAEARRTVEVARKVRVLGSVVHHRQLGVYSLLAMLSQDDLRNCLHPGLERLRRKDKAKDVLTETLEAFLDNAGSVKTAAEQLSIRPASLYYRLRRIEELTHADLNSGDDRLALHQSLKIVRLIGLR